MLRSKLLLCLVCISVGYGKAQTDVPEMDHLLLQMQQQLRQMMEQLGQGDQGMIQIDTFFFSQPSEPMGPFGVYPPGMESEELEQMMDQLRKSMREMEGQSFLDLSEFFRSFGDFYQNPQTPVPENPHEHRSEESKPPKKKRQVYRL